MLEKLLKNLLMELIHNYFLYGFNKYKTIPLVYNKQNKAKMLDIVKIEK